MKFRNRLQHVLEILIILLLVVGGVSLFFAEPFSGAGPVAQVLGSVYAGYFYATVFITEALALVVAKVFKKKTLRKNSLMVIYLTLLFTILLEFLLTGFGVEIIDNVLASIAAGWCWLHWKLRTEYVDPATFETDIDGLRDDSPPSRQYKYKD